MRSTGHWLALTALTVLAFGAAPAAASTVTVSGVVHCHAGGVAGVWVQSSGGGSKFASWKAFRPGGPDAAYSASIATRLPTTVELHVGCGGTPAKWGSSDYSPKRSISGSRVLNAFCDGVRSCIFPTKGRVTTRNLGLRGQCTEGAFNQWHAYTGFWPQWSGDAWAWSTSAAQNGYVVTSVPMPKSVIVFPRSSRSPLGHVAWVIGISQSSSGAVSLSLVDENLDAEGLGHISYRTIPVASGYRYIPAP
jgi:surface antigen